MKNLFFFFLILSLSASAQDTIFKRDGSHIRSFILRVKNDSIRYKKMDDLKGPDLFISRSEVSRIRYKSGRVENLDSLAEISAKVMELIERSSPEELMKMGKKDAKANYKCKGCTAYYGFLTFAVPPLGVVLGINKMVSRHEGSLNYPSKDLWTNKDYKTGYKAEIRAIKSRAINRGFWLGGGSLVAATVAVSLWSAQYN